MLPAILTLAVFGAWVGAEFTPSGNGLRASHVWPDGPAARAGLAAGDCIILVEGAPASSSDNMLDAIVEAPPGVRLRLTLSDGRVLRLRPEAPSNETLEVYCEWLQRRRIVIVASDLSRSPSPSQVWEVQREVTVGEVRRRIATRLPATLVVKLSCRPLTYRTTVGAPDTEKISGDASVRFDLPILARPPRPPPALLLMLDGGTCEVASPPPLADGGLDYSLVPDNCGGIP